MRCRAAVAAGVLLWALTASAQLPAQPPRDRRTVVAPVGTGIVKGRVVDGQTGDALARVRVRLNGPGVQRPSVLTDSSGTFSFTSLPPGPYTLAADKSTYLQGRYPESGQTLRTGFRPMILDDGQVLDNVSVAMFHGGAISGRVIDAHGDPIENAQVQVLRMPRTGRGRPQMRGGGSTNDLGEFRVARLEPGKYLVLVVPRRFGPPEDVGPDAQPAPTFYPGVLAIDLAQPIAIERGVPVAGLDLMVADGATATVAGMIVDASGQPVTRNASVTARVVMKDMPGGWDSGNAQVKPDGTFQLKLSPGDYQIEATSMRPGLMGPPQPGDQQFGSVRLTIGGDLSGLHCHRAWRDRLGSYRLRRHDAAAGIRHDHHAASRRVLVG